MRWTAESLLGRWAPRREPKTLHGLMQAARSSADAPRSWEPGKETVLVLAPHMDDEVIGCGGTIARHTDAGSEVTVVYLTDGRSGHPDVYRFKGAQRVQAQRRLIARRKEEARLAQEILGVRELRFMDAIDTRLAADASTVSKLREILEALAPTRVYLPHFLEQHGDHRIASKLLLEAVKGTGLDFHCHGYEVWTPLVPNMTVCIDSTMARKQRAMDQYRSQLEDRVDLMHAMNGLAAFRSRTRARPGERFVESFCALTLADYREAHEEFVGPSRSFRPGRANAAEPDCIQV